MILDGHIHILSEKPDSKKFPGNLRKANVEGGIIFSYPPPSFPFLGKAIPFARRLDKLLELTDCNDHLFPFFWLDPLDDDAEEQVNEAIAAGVSGFKIICNHFYPSDPAAMKTFEFIAKKKKPILFHSGILFDGAVSSSYNRPCEFEALLEIPHLRFALAHLSWPWCDECIALFGKFLSAAKLDPEISAEMFIDITPGTPPIFRQDAMTKLFSVPYGATLKRRVFFGSDLRVNSYCSKKIAEWEERDTDIFRGLKLDKTDIKRIYRDNLLRFAASINRQKNHTIEQKK